MAPDGLKANGLSGLMWSFRGTMPLFRHSVRPDHTGSGVLEAVKEELMQLMDTLRLSLRVSGMNQEEFNLEQIVTKEGFGRGVNIASDVDHKSMDAEDCTKLKFISIKSMPLSHESWELPPV
ncbi:hypothetical protein MMC30_000110 [Trapelia coarctata]|nr:hypothetical protein [Trapelia coarctata]